MKKNIFITGATGFVGRNLIAQILNTNPETNLTLLVRGNSQSDAELRMDGILNTIADDIVISEARKHIEVVVGDVTSDHLGLSPEVYSHLAQKITDIIHSAASIEFQHPLPEARLINVGGTESILKLARQSFQTGNLQRLAYISTAYVCGNRSGIIYEHDLKCGQQFSNSYEQSKFEAEQILHHFQTQLPITIFRPSIIVGNSDTGKTSAFNVLYYPLKLLSRGVLKFIPGSPQIPLDVVPVNYVCAAICSILHSEKGIGQTFHLTSGPKKVSTLGEILEMAINYFTINIPFNKISTPKFISPHVYSVAKHLTFSRTKDTVKRFEQYIPYFHEKKIFDNINTLNALSEARIVVPHFSKYFERLLKYCLEVDWGKRLSYNT